MLIKLTFLIDKQIHHTRKITEKTWKGEYAYSNVFGIKTIFVNFKLFIIRYL